MSEPKARATSVEVVVPGLWRWSIWDERIDFQSDAHAIATDAGSVLIDPLPLSDKALAGLLPIAAICLTAACHQRSSWRYRRANGVKVYAPEGCRAMEEEPDVRYREGDVLTGGLRAVHTPGPEPVHFAFWREHAPAVLFCPDLIMRAKDGDLEFIPAEYHDNPQATRESVRKLLELPFTVLCMDHGAPLTSDPRGELRKLLGEGAD